MAQNSEKIEKLISSYCRIESNDMNIVDGIISIIFEYYRAAKWSRRYKGKTIKLFEDDSKAMCLGKGEHSVRANFCIEKGQIVSWELKCLTTWQHCNFFGVVSSRVTRFNNCPAVTMYDAYGVEDEEGGIVINGDSILADWNKPAFIRATVFILKMVADWTEKQCKLTIYYNEKKLNENHDDYTILLPELDDGFVWYPCATPFTYGACCIINFAS